MATGQTLVGGAGNDTLTGGPNDDVISGAGGTDSLVGGAGNDTLTLVNGTVTGGDGQDLFVMGAADSTMADWTMTITDFKPGTGGDVLDLSGILTSLVGYTGGDPFGRYVWLEQPVAGTTVLAVNRDGAGTQYDAKTLVIFQNVFVNDLVAANFANGYIPTRTKITTDGTQTGTSASETLAGGWGNDTISGGSGNDFISDGAGNNRLAGDDGNDTIEAGSGDDTLTGGNGQDNLYGGAGNNSIDGGFADDTLVAGDGNDTIIGGDGNDSIQGGFGNDSIDGGDGDDTIGYSSNGTYFSDMGSDTIHGGNGNDTITVAGGASTLLFGDAGNDSLFAYGIADLNGGAGNDRLQSRGGEMTGGLGADNFIVNGVKMEFRGYSITTATITDLNVAEGDRIDLSQLLTNLRGFEGGNPFGKYLWLQQDGADTLVMVDPDLTSNWYDTAPGALLRLKNVTASSLTADAFVQGYDPSVLSQYQPQTITGGAGNDNLTGGIGNDSLFGGAGSDLLTGGDGIDILRGGDGIDAARFSVAYGGIGNVSIVQRTEPDGSQSFLVSDYRVTGQGQDTLYGVEIGIFDNKILPLIAPGKWSLNQPYDHSQFDESTYLALYPDVAQAVARDQIASGEAHYLAFGKNEGRLSPAKMTGSLALFDSNYYLRSNPDVASAVSQGVITSAWTHFVQFGEKEGRDPNTLFDTDWYLATNPDVAAAVATGGIDALSHYALYGWKEGRDPSRWFDTSAYLASNPDVAAAGVNPLLHYLGFGYYEGRTLTFTETLT